MKKGNPIALLPIGVFLIMYLGLGITFEYVLKIPMGFYNIPIVVAFLVALLTACIQNKKVNLDDKLEIMGKGVGDKNIITMILIFLEAGIFVGVVGSGSWAPQSGPSMVEQLDAMKEFTVLNEQPTVLSALNKSSYEQLEDLADSIVETLR